MSPHSFVPTSGLHRNNPTLEALANAKPRGVDVRMATEILMTAHKASGPEMRRKYLIDVIRGVPDDAIDWATVDWVQAAPFKTRRG